MENIQLDSLSIYKMAVGRLSLKLTEKVDWWGFPDYAPKLMQLLGGDVIKRNDPIVDMVIWDVRIEDIDFWFVYEDFPQMVSLEPSKEACDALIHKLYEKLKSIRDSQQ